MKGHKNQHEWGVVYQCKSPYREFSYCPLCGRYKEGNRLMTKSEFESLALELKLVNSMYIADSLECYDYDQLIRKAIIN